ncbi:tail length tape measure protein [Arthrobacter phage Adumb2043]|uniref:Tape measure protein n=1 Tax=Arthrobacter phage Adumb2043 TaxID=2776851 RepID=A0A7M1CL74_9CAUD|nr:tail length tape measure protein [Arthrobacter phage Adumb2043]QOP65076.1 tape measure protein [Arthrobacter phage Adumb2043]
MSNVGYATLTILPSAKGFSSALGREINPALTAAGSTSGQRSGKAFGGGFLPAMKSMIGPAVGLAAGLGLGQGIKSGLETAAFMENATISFETLLGSKGAAKKMIADVSKFAASTPFEMPGLTDNVRALLGSGAAAKSVLPTMTALGDTNAALGGNQERLNSVVRAWTQMMGKGKVSAEEMLQITEAGIPIWAIASRAMGKPVGELQKMASEGKLLSSDVLPLLETQMNKDYGGSMAKQAKTLSGVWSTVKDTVNMAMAQALQPLVPILTTILPPAADALAKGIGWVSDAISGLSSLIVGGDFTGALTRAFGWEEDSGIVDKILTIRTAVMDFFTQIQTGSGPAGGAFKAITDALTPLWNIIVTQVWPAIQNLVSAFQTGIQPVLAVLGDIITTSIIPAFQQMAAQAGPLFTQLGQTINVVAAQIGPILQGVADVIRNVWGFIGPFVMSTLQGIFANIVGVFSGIFTVIQGVVNLISAIFRGDWNAAWQALGQIVSGAVQAVWNFIQLWIVGRVVAGLGAALGFVRGLFSGAWSFVTGVVRGAVSGISSIIGWLIAGMRGVISGGLNTVRGLFTSIFNGVLSFLRGVWSGITNGVSSMIGNVIGFFGGLLGKITGAIGNAGAALWNVGRQIIQGLIDGIGSMMGAIGRAILSLVPGPIVGVFKDLLGIHSPSRVFRGFGVNIGEGLILGIKDMHKDVGRAVEKLAGIPASATMTAPTIRAGGVTGAIETVAGGAVNGSGTPLVGQLTLQSSGNVRDDVEETLFHIRRISRGGLYG